jgi:hypothetical protein
MRGGLSTIDRDYGIFNKVHHDIGTHVVHHLFPQIPHYKLVEATEAVKPVLGEYYRWAAYACVCVCCVCCAVLALGACGAAAGTRSFRCFSAGCPAALHALW